MNAEEIKQALMNYCVVVNDALEELIEELIREAQEDLSALESLYEMYYVRPPVEIKKEIKHEKNPMRLKQLNRELNESYKAYRKKRKGD